MRRRPCPQNWDGLQLQGKDELSERYQDEFGVEIWLEKDIPEEPKEEAEELFDWWNDLDDVYVLIFQLHSDEDGIFTLKDSSASSEEEDSNNNFILSFESAEEAASYAVKLSNSLQGLKAEIECMERDELLQVSSRWRNGTRMRRQLPLPRYPWSCGSRTKSTPPGLPGDPCRSCPQTGSPEWRVMPA